MGYFRVFTALTAFLFTGIAMLAQNIDKEAKQHIQLFRMPATAKSGDYIEKTIVVKVKQGYNNLCSADHINHASFNELYQNIGGTQLRKKFPNAKAPTKNVNEKGEKLANLTLVYEFSYTAHIELEKAINKFISLSMFEYVEPHYIPLLCYTPNDPQLANQYALTNIQAEAAWGVNTTTARGDTNIVIGITDTGVDPNHLDLKNNIKHNYSDPIGGGDNDGDGYIDNFSGWDLGENDNDPSANANSHGIHVSGIAAASTDNATGMAGVGFKCKFLPIKISNSTGALTQSYEGIAYAAEHGCAIINCSWGSETSSQLGQDVVDYATINHNALVVAAAGNNASDQLFYPASFNYVISVANTKGDDRRSSTSNFNYSVDVCAPGENIYSTYTSGTYSTQTGTSMSAPCVAGAAAIVKSFYPSYTALQIGERLKTTCDNIYNLMSPIYANKLGKGRINLYRALTDNLSPSVVTTQRTISDNNDNTFVINDTLHIIANHTNYLGATNNLTATLSTTSAFVQIVDGNITLGSIPTLGIANNNSDPYRVKILSNAPANQVVNFKITYSDPATSYTSYEFFSVVVNVDYINITVNDVHTTIGSNGRIGYSQTSQGGGLGFNYMNNGTILYEAGLMVGMNGSQVSDAVRGVTVPEEDFQSIMAAKNVSPAVFSDFDVEGVFKDNLGANPLPINVHHRSYAWSTSPDRKYVIVEYVISNTGVTALNNLYAGVFADWDIDLATFASNRAAFDAVNKMGYAYYTGTNGTYAGIKLLTSSAPVVHYAIDNVSGGAGGIDMLTSGFDATEKYTSLSTSRATAGASGNGADVIDVVSTGPYTIGSGDSIRVAFALIAGDNLTDIQTSATNAQVKYNGIHVTTNLANEQLNAENTDLIIAPNPSTKESTIKINIVEDVFVSLNIVDVTGKKVQTITNKNYTAGNYSFDCNTSSLSRGIYYCQLMCGEKKIVKKMVIIN
ncbi:MAG: S8 family serine peptidase [Bacteroidia bacterium]